MAAGTRRGIFLLVCVAAIGCGSGGGGGGKGHPLVPAPVPVQDDFCSDSWCWVSPEPQGNDLEDAWVDDQGMLWVVGAGPTLATWDGSAWKSRKAPGTDGLVSIWGVSPTDMWVGSSSGSAWHYDGFDWTEFQFGSDRAITSIYGIDSDDVWTIARGDRLERWDGKAWSKVGDALSGTFLHSVWESGSGEVWAVGDQGYGNPGVLLRGDATSVAAIQSPTTEPLLAVSGTSADDVWVAGENGAVWYWDGKSWQDRSVPNGALLTILDLLVLAPDDVWFTTIRGYPQHWDGNTWTPIEAAPVEFAATRSDGKTIWTVGQSGEVDQRDGTQWKSLVTRVTNDGLYGVWVDQSGQAWIVGEGGTVLKASATDVQPVSAPPTTRLLDVSGNGIDVWAVAFADLFHDSGSGFSAVDPGPFSTLGSVWATAGATWVGGRYELGMWDGSAWTNVGTSLEVLGLWGTAPDDVWAVGRYGAVEHHHQSTYDPYSVGSTGQEGLDIGGSGPSDVWVVTQNGHVYRGAGPLTDTESPGIRINAVWVAAPDEAYVAGEGLARWDGSQWVVATGIQPTLDDVSGANGEEWAVGPHGAILHRKP